MPDTVKKIRTGLFGGSFNPVHNGHISLARQILHLVELDEIWFVVSPQNPLKRRADLLDDGKRVELMRLALKDEQHLIACDYELHLPKPSYTYNTLQAMRKDYPNRTFTLIIGADNWACFHKWLNNEAILSECEVVIYPRRDYPVDVESLPRGVTLVNTELFDVSSTEIRNRIASGEDVSSLVPPAVSWQIEKEKLYQ